MKYLAVVKIVTPSDVLARHDHYDNGAVYVDCPEMGFEGDNLLYCRYGLSNPYIKLEVDDKVWIESTIGNDERWIYTGFADARHLPVDNDEVMLEGFSGVILQIKDAKAYLQRAKDNAASENVVLGQELKGCLSAILGSLSSCVDALDGAMVAYALHYHTAFGAVVGVPDGVSIAAFSAASTACGNTKTVVDAQKTSPVDDEKMLSDFYFTEK